MSINTICEWCHMAECEHIDYKEILMTFMITLKQTRIFPTCRKIFQSYQNWTGVFNGVLGRENRILIPNCVKKEIENRFPWEEGDVGVGFKLQNDNK